MEKNDLEIDNLPNRLTFFRMLMIPVVVLALYFTKTAPDVILPYQPYMGWIACWIFIVAGFTDFLDGYFARKYNIVTVFGSFLDPIADKFLIVSSLIMLLALDRVNSIVVIILVVREMYMTSLRLLAMNEGISVPVSALGKWKTGFQMVATPMLMVNEPVWVIPIPLIGTILMYIAAFLSMGSALHYSYTMLQKLREDRTEKKRLKKLRKEEA
jgi:CDP-diacylglycerol--glycerol-3-phosphate 3-phosphatidyltransferase